MIVNREIKAQQNDLSLTTCFSSAVASEESEPPTVYFIENGVLMRRWSMDSEDLKSVDQVVVSNKCRLQVLSLAHDASLGGHLGEKKHINMCLLLAWNKV